VNWSKKSAPRRGDDVALDVYDANWVRVSGAGRIMVAGGSDRLEGESIDISYYRYAASGSPTGDQLVRANVRTGGPSAQEHFVLMARMGATGNGYAATWRPFLNVVRLYRVILPASSSLLESASVTVGANTTYQMCVKVTGTNPCVITVSDDVNGELISYEDDDASRHTSGYPGLFFNASANLMGSSAPAWVDDLEIEDWSSGAGVNVLDEDFVQFEWTKLSPP
jgi:hypothetical protein